MLVSHVGRYKITTEVEEITYENVLDVLRKAYGVHISQNVPDIIALMDYESGKQPLDRVKKVRPDIDCYAQDNLAHYIVERHLGFDWSNPITIIQRGEKDSGVDGEAEAISLFNECDAINGSKSKTQDLGRYVEITGLGYTYDEDVKKSEYEDGDSPFETTILNPLYAFVVYSARYKKNKPVMGVTFWHSNETGNNYFTCFTKTHRYEIINLQEIVNGDVIPEEERWKHLKRSGEINPLNRIPIIEYTRSHDRTGAFEHSIPSLDQLNLLLSDYSNSVEQNIQSIWHANDVDFPTEIIKNEDGTTTEKRRKPKTGEMVETQTTADGKTPFINPLTLDSDYSGQLANINALRSRILEENNIPNRDTTSGGSTGVATDTATGYDAFEEAAMKKQLIISDARMAQLEVQLACIRNSLVVEPDNPMLKLRARDCEISIKRSKNYELTTKINFFATAVSHGVNGLHALNAANIWGDNNQVWEDSQEGIIAYQKSIFDKNNDAEGGEGEQKPNNDRIDQDLSDQISNSPFIDGTSTEG